MSSSLRNVMDHAGRKCLAGTALACLGLVAFSAPARACTATVMAPIVIDKSRSTHPDTIRMIWDDGTNVDFGGCPAATPMQVDVTVSAPGMRWVTDVDFTAYPLTGPLPLYEVGQDSALIGFVLSVDSTHHPMRIGTNRVEKVDANGNQIVIAYVYSRGGRMRDFQALADVQFTAPLQPTLNATVPVSVKMTFPPTTCLLRDASEMLQDVAASELAAPGATAKEKTVAIRMDCAAAVPRADVMLTDAGDAANTGSMLTPSADSNAKGVRVQLLRSGVEVQFGQAWDFNPGTDGVHDHEFTARYIRVSEPLGAGAIKGEAIFTADYW